MSFLDDPQVRRNVDRLHIEFDDYGFDRFGLSKKSLVRAYSPMAYVYRRYLKVTSFGLENVYPEVTSGALKYVYLLEAFLGIGLVTLFISTLSRKIIQ